MQRFIFILCLAFWLHSCSHRKQDKAIIKFADFIIADTLDYNFNSIKEKDNTIHHDFIFKNLKSEKLFISAVPAACPCISVEYPKKIILPRENFSIRISYNPKGNKGFFKRQIMVIFNNGAYFINPTIKGFVE